MKAAIHNECGQVAFYLDDDVSVRSPCDHRKAYDLDGKHPKKGSQMQCFSCGATDNLKITIDWEDTSYALQQGRVEEKESDQAGLASVPSS